MIGTGGALVLAATLVAQTGDGVLDNLEAAMAALGDGKHALARTALERATKSFDRLELDGTSLEKAFVSDSTKPYRGRPHERVFALTLLAALDVERGRCDLALPSLRDAAFNDVKRAKSDVSDAVVVHALAVRCLVATGAQVSDVARAHADLKAAAGERADDVERAVLADDAVLVLDGYAPTYESDGADGQRAKLVPSKAPAPASVVQATAAKRATAVIRLGGKHATAAREGLVVWSSTQQATTVQGRPFDDVLAERARTKDTYNSAANARMQQARTTAQQRDVRNPRAALGNIASTFLLASTGAGLAVAGAATDARADTRSVTGMFERAILVGGG